MGKIKFFPGKFSFCRIKREKSKIKSTLVFRSKIVDTLPSAPSPTSTKSSYTTYDPSRGAREKEYRLNFGPTNDGTLSRLRNGSCGPTPDRRNCGYPRRSAISTNGSEPNACRVDAHSAAISTANTAADSANATYGHPHPKVHGVEEG